MNYYVDALKKYFVFSGRASRREFWWFIAPTAIACVALFLGNAEGLVCALTLDTNRIMRYNLSGYFKHCGLNVFGVLFCYVFVVSATPFCSSLVRRLHDTGRSGKNLFWLLVPVFGAIILLSYLVQRGHTQSNAYDLSPKNNKNGLVEACGQTEQNKAGTADVAQIDVGESSEEPVVALTETECREASPTTESLELETKATIKASWWVTFACIMAFIKSADCLSKCFFMYGGPFVHDMAFTEFALILFYGGMAVGLIKKNRVCALLLVLSFAIDALIGPQQELGAYGRTERTLREAYSWANNVGYVGGVTLIYGIPFIGGMIGVFKYRRSIEEQESDKEAEKGESGEAEGHG